MVRCHNAAGRCGLREKDLERLEDQGIEGYIASGSGEAIGVNRSAQMSGSAADA